MLVADFGELQLSSIVDECEVIASLDANDDSTTIARPSTDMTVDNVVVRMSSLQLYL